ncbi:MAG: hypothetical protein AAFR66_05305 [Bacteroidota bacterium]
MRKFIFGSILTLSFCVFLTYTATAQKFSATVNVSQFKLDKVDSEVADINYQGSSSIGVNLRYYTDNKWAFRLGAGLDNLQYEVGGGITTDYQARRQDITGVFGIEKHFMVGDNKWLDIYPGAFIPVVVVGEDVVQSNLSNISNGNVRAGLGVLLGANVRVLKILRLGVEFDATYDNFKNQVWESAETLSLAPVKGINVNTAFTVGVAF